MEQLKGIDEEEMLETMPERLHRDVAMDMHFEILKKVKLFEGCDEQLLIDLVLYLRKPLKFWAVTKIPNIFIFLEADQNIGLL